MSFGAFKNVFNKSHIYLINMYKRIWHEIIYNDYYTKKKEPNQIEL